MALKWERHLNIEGMVTGLGFTGRRRMGGEAAVGAGVCSRW